MSITIYHNPNCSKSRQTLELIRGAGIEPTIIEYMKTPPSADTLRSLIARLGVDPVDMIRRNEKAFEAMNIDENDPESVVEAIATEPRLMQRPVVVSGNSACLGRPPENVLPLLNKVTE